MSVELVKVKEQDDGMRLNRWFLKYYPDLPLSRLQKLLRTKQIKVDGKKAETSLKLQAGWDIRIPPLEDKPQEKAKDFVSDKNAEMIKSMVIYKDNNIIVLNKPSGLAVQGGTNIFHHIDAMLPALKYEKEEQQNVENKVYVKKSLTAASDFKWSNRATTFRKRCSFNNRFQR